MLDKVKIENIIKLLRRGKWELGGEEILAFHQSFAYLVEILNKINQLEAEQKIAAASKIVQEEIKIDKVKKSKKA